MTEYTIGKLRDLSRDVRKYCSQVLGMVAIPLQTEALCPVLRSTLANANAGRTAMEKAVRSLLQNSAAKQLVDLTGAARQHENAIGFGIDILD